MTFKQFYLLKEDPDYAMFNLQDESVEIDYKDKHHTFITLDNSIFFTSINYHGSLLNNIWDYLNNNYSKRILRNKGIIELGEVRKQYSKTFLKTFENSRDTGLFRSNMLNSFPKELLGRAWVKNINGADHLLVTIWNDQKYYTLKNLNLIKWMAEFLDINDSEKIIFETNLLDKSKNLLEMISSVNDAQLQGRVGSADTSGNKPIHELPPEQKKQALIKMGAKPKVPMGIQDKTRMNVESFEQFYKKNNIIQEQSQKSIKYNFDDDDPTAFDNLTQTEKNQLGTKNFVSKEMWPSFRKFLLKKSIASNPLTDPQLTAYTPGETLNLLNNPIIKDYHKKIIDYKVPKKYDTIIFVPCAKTKPWQGACKGIYKSYNKIKQEHGNVYFVTISEPLAIVPQDLWSSFPQYDNPGLFKDPVMRSGLMTTDWKKIFGSPTRLQTPFDADAYKQCIEILGNIIKIFIKNNPDFKYISFVEDFKGKGTHSEMLDVAGFIDASIRHFKRESPRQPPYNYIKKFIN